MSLTRLTASTSRTRGLVSAWTPSKWLIASISTSTSSEMITHERQQRLEDVSFPHGAITRRSSGPRPLRPLPSEAAPSQTTEIKPHIPVEAKSIPSQRIFSKSSPSVSTSSAPSAPARAARQRRQRSSATSIFSQFRDASLGSDVLPSRLPVTSAELLSLLHHLGSSSSSRRTNQSRLPIPVLCQFHSDPQLGSLVSLDSYAYLLRRAYQSSNYALANRILAELTSRGLSRDDETISRIVLRYALKRGDGLAVAAESQKLRLRGVNVPQCINWRRDLLEDGKSKGDGLPTWKGRERGRVPRKRRGYYENLIRGAHNTPSLTAVLPAGTANDTRVFDRNSTLLPRAASTRAPSDLSRLAAIDIAALVESFVIDRNAQRAFESAQMWLDKSRTRLFTASQTANEDERLAAGRSYEKTAVVLLNILLKSLYASKVSSTSIRDFVQTFIARHSISITRPLRPGLSTLRTLITGNYGYHESWFRSVKLVDWFTREFGLPVATPVRETVLSADRLGGKRPSSCVDDTVAYLLVGLAIKDQRRKRNKDSRMKALIVEWWKELCKVRQERGWGGLKTGLGKLRVTKAEKMGLFAAKKEV